MPNGNILNSSINNNTLNVTYRPNYFNYGDKPIPNLNNNLPVVVDDNNRILIGGTHINPTNFNLDLQISRYNNAGNIDNTFSSGGILNIDVSNNSLDIINDIKTINNNLYILGSYQLNASNTFVYVLFKYNENGTVNYKKELFNNSIECNGDGYLILDSSNNYIYIVDSAYIYRFYMNTGNYKDKIQNSYTEKILFLEPSSHNLFYAYEIPVNDNKLIQINIINYDNIIDNSGNSETNKIINNININNIISFYIDKNGYIYIVYTDTDNKQKLLKLSSFTDPEVLFNRNIVKSINDIYYDTFISIKSDDNNVHILLYTENSDVNQPSYLLTKYSNNDGKFIKNMSINIDNQYIYTNQNINIDNNGNVFIDHLKILISDSNYTFFDIYKINTNYVLDNSFGNSGNTGKLTNTISNIIAEPVDMIITYDNKLLIGGTTFYNNYDFGLTKIDLFGEIDNSFGNSGNKIIDISNNSIDLYFNINYYNNNDGIDKYIISGLSNEQNNNNYVLQFVIIDSSGSILSKLKTDLNVKNLYNVFGPDLINSSVNDTSYYVIYTDINDKYNFIEYYIRNLDIDLTDSNNYYEYNFNKTFYNPQFLKINDYLLINDKDENNNLLMYLYKIDSNISLVNTFSFNIKYYYNNLTNITKIYSTFNKFYKNNGNLYIYTGITITVSNLTKLLLFNFMFDTQKEVIKLNTSYNNNTGYISNDNYKVDSQYSQINTKLIDKLNIIFRSNITINKIDIDTTQNLILGGTLKKSDVSGNGPFFIKVDTLGEITAAYQDQNTQFLSGLDPFILTKYGEVIFSTYNAKKPLFYLNNSNLVKLDNNLTYLNDFQQDDVDNLNITYRDNDNNFIVIDIPPNKLIKNTLDESNKIYQILYDMTNYPNYYSYQITIGNNTFNMYKELDVRTAISDLIRKLKPYIK